MKLIVKSNLFWFWEILSVILLNFENNRGYSYKNGVIFENFIREKLCFLLLKGKYN